MSDYELRRLGRDDVATMRSVLALYARVFDDRESYLAKQPDDAYLRRLLDSGDFVQMIASNASQDVVGALSGYVLHKFEQARSELYIYDLAVDEDHRRRGIAQSLIEALGPVAQANGAWVVFVQADYGDDPAIALYDKLGAREDVLHFDIKLDRH